MEQFNTPPQGGGGGIDPVSLLPLLSPYGMMWLSKVELHQAMGEPVLMFHYRNIRADWFLYVLHTGKIKSLLVPSRHEAAEREGF